MKNTSSLYFLSVCLSVRLSLSLYVLCPQNLSLSLSVKLIFPDTSLTADQILKAMRIMSPTQTAGIRPGFVHVHVP